MAASWLTNVFNFLAGATYNSSPPVLGDGSTGGVQCDSRGRLIVTPIATNGVVGYSSGASTYQGVMKATPGNLWSLNATNNGASTRWLQLFDAAAVQSNGAVPKVSIPIAAGVTNGPDLAGTFPFATGITWMISSTAATLTVDTAATFFISGSYT